ncbi:nucleoid occlusion factor SlmA [Derxia lacustris]|uniref:nucleoid occlusion factor SlmA n=1 Tax=Derxia lacustris TaxID=764842 RepID=UPI000A174468|nr:nucleoid occlusion factor SlmA [Derxia lacustris]
MTLTTLANDHITDDAGTARKRAYSKPGERRVQILQALGEMLEHPKGERITTAALAARLEVSEAALYRHFASKAQMFESLIEFIEGTLLGITEQCAADHDDGIEQTRALVLALLGFAEQNRGMTRVLVGDALVGENDRLQVRMNELFDRLEAAIARGLRAALFQGRLPDGFDVDARANLVLSYVGGKWHRYAKSGWLRAPGEGAEGQIATLLLV